MLTNVLGHLPRFFYPLPHCCSKDIGGYPEPGGQEWDVDFAIDGVYACLDALHECRVRRPLLEGMTQQPPRRAATVRLALRTLRSQVLRLGDAPAAPSCSTAICAMLGSATPDRVDRSPTVKDYDPAAIRILSAPVGSVPILPLLSKDVAWYLEDPVSRMLKTDEELRQTGAHGLSRSEPSSDPRLRRGSGDLFDLVRRLKDAELILFSRVRRGRIGVFAVGKKDKDSQRLVFDCRFTNCLFKDPPGTDLSNYPRSHWRPLFARSTPSRCGRVWQ